MVNLSDQMPDETRSTELVDRQKQRDFVRYKFDRECELKEKEIAAAAGRGLTMTAAQATVAAALLTLLGGMFGAVIQWKTANDTESKKVGGELAVEVEKSRASMELERHKFETTLILKAVESNDEAERTRNLQFFLKAGFISDPDGKIAKIDPQDYPSTPIREPVAYDDTDLNDPTFADLPRALIDLMARLEGPRVNGGWLRSSSKLVEKWVTVPLNINQKSALTALLYNVGGEKFKVSTLLADINAGHTDHVVDDFIELAPRRTPRLLLRRNSEATLFLTPPS